MNYVEFVRKVEGKEPLEVKLRVKPRVRLFISSTNIEFAQQVLDGDVTKLSSLFIWQDTPQGHNYWYDRHRGEVDMLEEDYEFIRNLMEDYNEL